MSSPRDDGHTRLPFWPPALRKSTQKAVVRILARWFYCFSCRFVTWNFRCKDMNYSQNIIAKSTKFCMIWTSYLILYSQIYKILYNLDKLFNFFCPFLQNNSSFRQNMHQNLSESRCENRVSDKLFPFQHIEISIQQFLRPDIRTHALAAHIGFD